PFVTNYTVQVVAHAAVITPPGSTFVDNGVTWRVLHDDGNGNKFVCTDRVIADAAVVPVPVPGTLGVWDNWNTPNFGNGVIVYKGADDTTFKKYEIRHQYNYDYVHDHMDQFYVDAVSPTLKAMACLPNITYERNDHNGAYPGYSNTETDLLVAIVPGALSTPGALANGTTYGITFPLSVSEVNTYLGTANTARRALGYNTTSYKRYWLRSPSMGRSFMNLSQTNVLDDGRITASMEGERAIRPAMWINVN
ncbi:MAG: DUF6273 domain-containing protein, partial [Kiritimatiellaeota bacterium]|nr:DUF6273 domain-containing protein [Kiritimatiellota bacterium]